MELLTVNIAYAGYLEQKNVIKDINFSVSEGEIVGLIGQNGAGKTTTFKTILGILKEHQSEIVFKGKKQLYAYIPEQPIYYDELTLWEHLEIVASLFEMDREAFNAKSNYLLDLFRMQKEKHFLPNSFSKGMQQKLMLILAFLVEPDIYIVDEPFIGLDPKAIKDFLELLNEEKEKGKSVLISTHVLDTAEKICDRFLIIEGGQLMADGTIEEIKTSYNLQSNSLLDCFYEILETKVQ